MRPVYFAGEPFTPINERFDLLSQVIDQIRKLDPDIQQTEDCLTYLHQNLEGSARYPRTTPFEFAKLYRVLRDESAEDFMIQYMTEYNRLVTHYY